MITKRNKGFTSLDLALPVAPYYQNNPQVLKDVENMRKNAASRWKKHDYSRTQSRFHTNTNIDENVLNIAPTTQPKLELLRANSPTFKRLLAARIKLEKYSHSLSRSINNSRQTVRSIRETPYPKNYENQSSAIVQQGVRVSPPPILPPFPPPAPAPPMTKPTKSRTNQADKPLDKITYEKTWSLSGNMRQKCSLEIWLPKPRLDDDDDERTTNRTITPDMNKFDKKSQSIPINRSRRSSIIQTTATVTVTATTTATTTLVNTEVKPTADEKISRKSEPVIVPHVYHYADYIMDLPEDRPRSSKSVTTIKSDSGGSIKSLRRQQTRLYNHNQSQPVQTTEEILRFNTIEVPTSAKAQSINSKSTPLNNREIKSSTKSMNAQPPPPMISDLMQKYSLIKKSSQETTQTNTSLNQDQLSPRSRRSGPPPVPESTMLVSPDHPTVTVKRLLLDTSPIRSMSEHSNPTAKFFERRLTTRKASRSDIYPNLKIFSLANQRQIRQTSATTPGPTLTNSLTKKSDEPARTLQRSKTMDVVLDIPNPIQINKSTRRDESPQHVTHRLVEQSPSRASKRPLLTPHGEKPSSNSSNLQTSGQHIHRLTTIPTNTLLIHFDHRNNNERHSLVPE